MEYKTVKLSELLVNFDSKRIPLSSRERAQKQGKYPYYGATSILDYVDEYLFDGSYILLGEDGTVMNPDGSPVLQRVSGKFWLNNHAHILKNTDKVDFDFLYYLLSSHYIYQQFCGKVSGAVVKNLNSEKVAGALICLPPLSEQQRIVNKIEELLNLCNTLKQFFLNTFEINATKGGIYDESI